MKDAGGRTIDYMRISITDRCNLRCKYCMPHGVKPVSHQDTLSFEEIREIVLAGAGLGIQHIKVTGGEPLVRKGCCGLIRMLKAVPGIQHVTLTTNGVLLEEYLDELVESGIDGINISLDTMEKNTYQNITGYNGLSSVMQAIKKASALPFPVKINAVSVDGREFGGESLEGWKEIVLLAKQYPVDVRMIEMMPIGYGKQYPGLSHKVLLAEMKKEFPGMVREEKAHGFGPAVYYQVPGFLGSIGFISAVHGKFCESCNRVRLTAQGYLKTCLCYEDGVDLRAILRDKKAKKGEKQKTGKKTEKDGVPTSKDIQERLTEAIREAIVRKPTAHCFEAPEKITENRNMVDIGG